MLNSETIGIAIGLISLLVAIITSGIAIKQNNKSQQFQNKLAEAQNVFAKSEIKIEFFQTYLKDIIFVGNFPNKSINKIPLEVYIANSGDKKIENAELYVTYPDEIHESNTNNINPVIKGSFRDIKHKQVEKSQFKHMLGFDYGDIPRRTVIQHIDTLVVSDYRKTDSTILKVETIAELKDKTKVNLKYEVALSWVIDFYLRHDDGSYSKNCNIQVWNTSEKAMKEYLKYCKPDTSDHTFDNYLKGNSFLMRIFFKRRLRADWGKTVQKVFLLVELDLQKDTDRVVLPKNAPKDAKNYSIYSAAVKQQNVLLVLNQGNTVLVSREEFEKRNSITNFDMIKHFTS